MLVKLTRPSFQDSSKFGSLSLPSVSTETTDNGKVRMGNMAPALPPARTAPIEVADHGKVRMGNMSPSLPARR